MAAPRLSVRCVRSDVATWVALSLLCGCAADRPTPVYPSASYVSGAVGDAALGALIGAKPYVRVARAVLYRGDEEGGQFGVFSYLIAAQKDPGSPVGQRLRAAIAAYAREAPYCPLDL